MSSEPESEQTLQTTAQPYCAPEQNPAIALCHETYTRAFAEAEQAGIPTLRATLLAREAYRQSMPPLTGSENIRDFIACVAHAMLLKVVDAAEASRLLYAAQVAWYAAKNTNYPRKTA
jgi:hypothetical protein